MERRHLFQIRETLPGRAIPFQRCRRGANEDQLVAVRVERSVRCKAAGRSVRRDHLQPFAVLVLPEIREGVGLVVSPVHPDRVVHRIGGEAEKRSRRWTGAVRDDDPRPGGIEPRFGNRQSHRRCAAEHRGHLAAVVISDCRPEQSRRWSGEGQLVPGCAIPLICLVGAGSICADAAGVDDGLIRCLIGHHPFVHAWRQRRRRHLLPRAGNRVVGVHQCRRFGIESEHDDLIASGVVREKRLGDCGPFAADLLPGGTVELPGVMHRRESLAVRAGLRPAEDDQSVANRIEGSAGENTTRRRVWRIDLRPVAIGVNPRVVQVNLAREPPEHDYLSCCGVKGHAHPRPCRRRPAGGQQLPLRPVPSPGVVHVGPDVFASKHHGGVPHLVVGEPGLGPGKRHIGQG